MSCLYWCRENDHSGTDLPGGERGQEPGMEEAVCEGQRGDSDMSGCDSESDVEGEEHVWGCLGVNVEAYKRKTVIWRNEIFGKGQWFSSADAFRCSIWTVSYTHLTLPTNREV